MAALSRETHRQYISSSKALGFLILLISWVILVWNIGGPSYSVDEFVNVEIDRGNLPTILAALNAGTDLHPPLSHLLMAAWIQIFGEREGVVRLLPAMFSWLSLSLLWQLTRSALNANRSWLAVVLLALTPTYLLYTRFEKYYALTIFFYLLLLFCTRAWWHKPTRQRLIIVGCVTVILLYTDYFASLFASVAIGLLLILGMLVRPQKVQNHYFGAWLLIQIGAAAIYLPWLNILYKQASALTGSNTDIGGSISSFILKLAVTGLSFSIGETLYPWHILGVVGICATLVLAIAGLLSFRHHKGYVTMLLTCLLSAVVGGALLSTVVLKGVPFAAFPNHVLFALPLVIGLLAVGAWNLPKLARAVILTAWGIASLAGQFNYHTGQEFLNPIYAVPTREIAYDICQQASTDAVVLAQSDTGIPFYLARLVDAPPSLSPNIVITSTKQPSEVWLFAFGRDRTRDMSDMDTLAREWLINHQYKLLSSRSFVPTDPFYANLKSNLIERDAYSAKAVLEQWQQPDRVQHTSTYHACTLSSQGKPLR
jgi:hypothetical protein